MKKIILTIAGVFATAAMVSAQGLPNLVVNPEFSTTKKVTYRAQLNKAEGWSDANAGTVDLFNEKACKTNVGIPMNFMGMQASDGNYIGFTAYYEDQIFSLRKTLKEGIITNGLGYGVYSEYPQGKLTEPMVAGQTYFIKFNVSLADKSGRAVKGLGVYFSSEPLAEANNRSLKINPQIVFGGDDYLDDKEGWTTLQSTYVAKGGEQYFTIGAFEGTFDVETVVIPKKQNDNKRAYYYLNHGIKVVKFPLTAEELDILKRAINMVNFNTNSAEIKSESLGQLDKIASILAKHPMIYASIEGHTDNTGTDEINNKLSKDRAKSVKDYLVSKGVDANKLHSEGYGSKRPIADNNTVEGRATNRRVVIITSLYKD